MAKHMLFVWVRNRNAAGRGNDPMPQIIHEKVGCAHLEIVASHEIDGFGDWNSISDLIARFPAPEVS